jgi:ABC-type phosphate transport system ATPase subunit
VELALDLKKKYCILIVTHNMQQAARTSDRTCFSLGEIIEYHRDGKAFSNPADSATAEITGGSLMSPDLTSSSPCSTRNCFDGALCE